MFSIRLGEIDFNPKAITNAADKAMAKFQSRAGAYGRQVVRNSLKYGEKKSAPGSPPIVHKTTNFHRDKKNRKTGVVSRQTVSPLRELIMFAYDPATKRTVIGPQIFRNARVPGLAPKLLEKGGVGTFQGKDGKIHKGNYKPRPFIAPAIPKVAAKFPDIIRIIE